MSQIKGSPIKTLMIVTIVLIGSMVALFMMSSLGGNNENEITYDNQSPIEDQPVIGDPNAPVTVVEFGDYKCPACKAWSKNYFPLLFNDFIKSGKVKFAYINVTFHGEESILGSLAAESVYKQNSESYWEFHKKLFEAQPESDHDASSINVQTILEVASTVPNVDLEQLQKDIEQKTYMNEVEKDTGLVEEFKVELTPSIMVNDTMLEDPFDYEKIKALIEEDLK